ncbi:unnamed protein product [Callosobruchus maculatus]|uniref:Transmembrane protein n=1 Tax=Callosobruchus maculatus TaxID=64391 RepID=A0A653C552_CALMS|nr:unnamed protein product [Callosobruchus maculatus]
MAQSFLGFTIVLLCLSFVVICCANAAVTEITRLEERAQTDRQTDGNDGHGFSLCRHHKTPKKVLVWEVKK